MARYTKKELGALSTSELAALLGKKLKRGRPSAAAKAALVAAAYAAKVKKG